jgi:hypothetical protein
MSRKGKAASNGAVAQGQEEPQQQPAAQEQQPQRQGGERQKPSHQVRVGRIQGTVWQNADKDGKPWFSVTISRSYKDNSNPPQWKQATSYGRDDLLTVAEVARLCWLFIAQQNGSKLDGNGSEGNGEHKGDDIPF